MTWSDFERAMIICIPSAMRDSTLSNTKSDDDASESYEEGKKTLPTKNCKSAWDRIGGLKDIKKKLKQVLTFPT